MKVNYVCSFGTLCHSSMLIKNNNLKLCSYPFDWIFSNPNIIISCLKDNFRTFLNKSHYVHINPTRCGHKIYHPQMFNHRNPLKNKEDYNYYVRCVNRFKKLLKNEGHKLFVMTFINRKDNDIAHKNKIINFNNELTKYTKNYTLLVINHLPNKKKHHYIFTKHNNIDFLELHTLSVSIGTNFKNKIDNNYLNSILMRKYNYNLK